VKGLARSAAAAAALVALALGAPAAGADTTWTKVSADFPSNSVVPSLGLTGATAVVAWTQATAPDAADLDAVSFATSPTQDVIRAATSQVATAWSQIDESGALTQVPGGGLQLTFAGIHSSVSGDPLAGLLTTQRNTDGTWAAPFVVAGDAGAQPWSAVSGAVPLIATDGIAGIHLFKSAVAHLTGAFDQDLQAQLGGCCGYHPRLAVDAGGRLWAAWYSNATDATGVYVQQLDPATAAPLAAPVKAPDSESTNNNSFTTALACAATCRVVYGNSPAGAATDRVVSWWPGATEATIADLAGTDQGAGRVLTAAYRADGRLWVAWFDGKSYRAVLGDASGAGGAVQDAGVPAGSADGAYALTSLSVGDNLLLAVDYAWKAADDPAPYAIFVNTVAPVASITTAPGPRDVQLQSAPGGKGFRIQVQYTIPKACTSARPCTLHAELRVRTGRRLYAVAPLPGDGAIVLGTRGTVAVPKGRSGKLRFYLTVGRAQLLEAPFTTVGASRVAETRLRVWYTPKGSQSALSVRDGRIKVAIARIRSGALPGLAGIL
jgi:hypothetical protein